MRTRLLLAGLLLIAGCGGESPEPPADASASPTVPSPSMGRPVVVDTDLAQDDFVALLFLLSSSAVDIRAVTVTGTGEVRCPRGVEVAEGLLALTGHDDVPVACGRSTPLRGERSFPDEWRDAADAAWGVQLPDVEAPSEPQDATELLVRELSPGDVSLLTLGPLTNVAEAFRLSPALAEQVPTIVVMGGAVDVPGNVFLDGVETPVAEWNVYVDPVAADEVIGSGASLTLVGLDATNHAPITPEFVGDLQSDARTDAAEIVGELFATNPMVASGDAYFWDPLAAAVLVAPDLVTTERVRVDVVTREGDEAGRTMRSADGRRVRVAVGADAEALEHLLLRTLNRE